MKKILVASDEKVLIAAAALEYAATKGVALEQTREISDVKAAIIREDVICFIASRDFSEFRTLRNTVGTRKIFLYFKNEPELVRYEEFVRVFNDVFVGEITIYDMVKILHKHCATSIRSVAVQKTLELNGYTLRLTDKDLMPPSGKLIKLTEREFDFVKFQFDRLLENDILEETIASIVAMDRKDALVYNLRKKIPGVQFLRSEDKTYLMVLDGYQRCGADVRPLGSARQVR